MKAEYEIVDIPSTKPLVEHTEYTQVQSPYVPIVNSNGEIERVIDIRRIDARLTQLVLNTSAQLSDIDSRLNGIRLRDQRIEAKLDELLAGRDMEQCLICNAHYTCDQHR